MLVITTTESLCVCQLEEFNLPLKRNQTYVMKYFMQYRAEVAYVIDQPKEQRYKVLFIKTTNSDHFPVYDG